MSDDRVAPHAMPDRIAIDAKGYGWRVWDDTGYWSMVPVNPDNSPIPQPVTWFVPEGAREADRRRITELESVVAWYWGYAGSCRCGARKETPETHPHVNGCVVGRLLSEAWSVLAAGHTTPEETP